MKKKNEIYFPLKWAEVLDLKKNLELPETSADIPFQDMLKLTGHVKMTLDDFNEFEAKYPEFISTYDQFATLIKECYPNKVGREILSDLSSSSLVSEWSRNKQVFVMDSDFINNLTKTDNFIFNKDMFDYLPYRIFFIDFNGNKDISEKCQMDGAFIATVKIDYKDKLVGNLLVKEDCDSVWKIHIVRVCGKLFFYDIIDIPNCDFEQKIKDLPAPDKLVVYSDSKSPFDLGKETEVPIDGHFYQNVILQSLCYLSSNEPDIRDNEETLRTYKKPNPNSKPKNKYSEIQKRDVGIKIGTIFRNYQIASRKTESVSTGKRYAPHSVKAHWQNYWFGSGNERVRKPKWKFEYWTGKEYADFKKEDSDLIKHNVKS